MTSQTIPVGHPTLTIKQLSPSVSASFSPNLHRWMKSCGHAYPDGGVAETVFRVLPETRLAKEYGAGTLMIGCAYNQYDGDTDFSGSLLIGVLCNGAKDPRYCFPDAVGMLEEIVGFWDSYLQVGRCAIDPKHKEHFFGSERYSLAGEVRTCLWCGEQHQKTVTPRTVFVESWITL
ncbi:hypothetical protein [Flavobacterium sp.]|uniref:hypothetical protein n=1 Tax=Flavobacterium sp. TaxID=239 RepID=UPI00261806A4|nr:hypothetical protein [Flavobacterium sp.]